MSTYYFHQTGMKKRERQEYVYRRARELAMSGECVDWLGVEFVLRYQDGFGEARQWLDSHSIREELDRLCEQARKAKATS